MSYETAEADRRIATLLQAGTIEAVDHAAARCRVRVGDWVSAWLPWASLGAGQVRNWRPPSTGEQALLFCPSGDPAQGFALPGFYTDQHAGNDNRPNITAQDWPDGAREEYDHEASTYVLDVPAAGSITLRCGPCSIVLSASGITLIGDITHKGNTAQTGTHTASADVLAAGVSLVNHIHIGVMPGPGTTGTPQ